MQTGYVYKLFSPSTDKVYIGSTALTFNDRIIRHKVSFVRYNRGKGRYSTAYQLLLYPDCVGEVVETVDFNDKRFLREREDYHMSLNNCVNKRQAVFNYETYYNDNKERLKLYYQENKEQKKLYQKQRYDTKFKKLNIELIRDF